MDEVLEAVITQVADMIVEAKKVIVFTGAGVSTESGIPDFRGPQGIWTKVDPNEYTFQRFVSDEEHRRRSWDRFKNSTWTQADPNPAHLAIAELEAIGKLDCLITQNVDGLHQKAGNSPENVIELHGTMVQVKCLDCGARFPSEDIKRKLIEEETDIPACESCGGMLKSATISFGEAMPEKETTEAALRSRNCDLFIVVGSSLVVQPAAMMPVYALQSGAKLVIMNMGDTPYDSHAHVLIAEKVGEVLPKIVEEAKQKLGVE